MNDSGKIELKRILNCMKDYEYDDSLERGEFDGYYKFNLTKRVDPSNDHTIKVTIEFSTGFDNENTYKKKANGDFLYKNDDNSKRAREFINKLMKDDSPKKGGQKKKQRKTKKNKEKQRKTKKYKQLHLLNY
jgi:hypothetical protein